jgi:hypothetical protein
VDEIRELLKNLSQLSAEDLDRLRGLIGAEFDTLDKEATTAEIVAAQNELADAAEQVMGQITANEAAQAEAEAARETARQRIAKLNGSDEKETEEVESPEAEAEETPEAEAVETVEEPAEAVTASGRKTGKIASMARRQGVAKPGPESPSETPASTALVASGEARGFPAGTELDKEKLAYAMSEALNARRGNRPAGQPGGQGRDVVIASASWADQYPDERRLKNQDWQHNTRVFKTTDADSLVATGGICAPVNVDYSIGMIADSSRPLQGAFPANQVSRGGLIYRPDLDFAALSSAIGIWTEATDLNPAGATKPIYTVACPSTDTVYVEAVTSRLGFGNMQSRFDPETVAANTDAALAAYARVAENNLLNLLAGACTQGVTAPVSTTSLGATRDLGTAIIQGVTAFRNLHRAYEGVTLRGVFPAWVKDLIRIDMLRETAHQQDGQWNSLMVTDQQIEDLFNAWGISPIFHIDGQSTSAPGLSGAVNQYFTAQSGSSTINPFPTKCAWYLYYEGAVQYLDGGRLDLGIVRDSLLDATNDYEVFVEVFETLAFRGFGGGAIQFISALCANGQSAGTVSTSSLCA